MAFDPKDAVEFQREVADAESTNRANALNDLKFSYGDQWDSASINSRKLEQRPWLTINKTDAFIRQVTNNQRQQRPRSIVHPMDGIADPKIAEILTGIFRHIDNNSDVDQAYDTAFDFACRMGWGYYRLKTDYIREDSFDQDIYVDAITNPFTVYFDPTSSQPDGSDANKCLITDLIPKSRFKKLYPGVDDQWHTSGTGDSVSEWITKTEIRIAEYMCVEREKADLVMLSDNTILWGDELVKIPPALLIERGLQVVGQRESYRRKVLIAKCTANEVLEEAVWPGRHIPIIPVYGDSVFIDGKRVRSGLVKQAKDPQIIYNFERTAWVESVAMAPKAKWLIAEGQDEGHENEWNRANVSAKAALRYKQRDSSGQAAPPPQRIQPEPPPAGIIEAAMAASADLQAVLGVFDPTKQPHSGVLSGEAKRADQEQSDTSNFHYFDNLTRSIKFEGRQRLELIPKIYDQQRIVRIIGDDGKPDLITVNHNTTDEQGIAKIMNDVTIGTYDVVMDTGPGFMSKRQESVEAMLTMTKAAPEIMHVAGDLIFRNMDFPGAEVIADRLAAANPMAQIDDKSDIPPKVQMMLKQLQTQNQQLTQQLQAAGMEIKNRFEQERFKQTEETKRELMKANIKAHESELWAAEEARQVDSVERTRLHDTQTKALSAQNVAELNGIVQLLLHHLDTKRLEQESDENEEELSKD